jgi:predicted nucleotidyltransferase
MPVRSLASSVLRWPDATEVDRAVREWGARMSALRPEVVRIGYFGSYAKGNWGPGRDVDLIVIVRSSEEPFERRAARWDTTELPVPADLLIYTEEEWRRLDSRLVNEPAIWVIG